MKAHDLLAIARDAAADAGRLLLERFRRPASGVGTKSTATDPVSDADRDAEALITERVRAERPGDAILAEEGGRADGTSGLTWVIDPLDGTVNFLFGIPHWSVSIAVEDSDGGLVGVVYDPCRDEMFTAVRGQGARLGAEVVRCSLTDDLSRALVATGFAYDPEVRRRQAELIVHLVPRLRDVRRLGSAAIDLAWTACGRYDGYYEVPVGPWDKAAGVLLVTEAGGTWSELPPLSISPGVLAAGPALHDALRDLVLEAD